jgi:hypothetical protein
MTEDPRVALSSERRSRSRTHTWGMLACLALILCSCQCMGSAGGKEELPPQASAAAAQRPGQHGAITGVSLDNHTRSSLHARRRGLLGADVDINSTDAPANMTRRSGRKLLHHRRSPSTHVQDACRARQAKKDRGGWRDAMC